MLIFFLFWLDNVRFLLEKWRVVDVQIGRVQLKFGFISYLK